MAVVLSVVELCFYDVTMCCAGNALHTIAAGVLAWSLYHSTVYSLAGSTDSGLNF